MAKKAAKVIELPGMKGPGVAPVKLPFVDKLCEKYVRARDRRMAETPQEVAAKTKLIDAIHVAVTDKKLLPDKDGTVVYRFDETVIVLKPGKETLSVRDVPAGKSEE